MFKIEGIVENNTKTGDVDNGEWGIKTKDGFIICGDLLAELDIFLNRFDHDETDKGTKIKIIIDGES